jgi:hypothetical protein
MNSEPMSLSMPSSGMGNPLTDAVDRAPPTRSWLCLPRCSSDRFTPPAADSRDGAHRRKALPPPPPNRWLHTPQLGARPCPAIHVSASRCSRRRIPTGSSADAARRLRRYRRDRQPVWSGIVNWRSTRSSAGRAAASSHTVVRNGSDGSRLAGQRRDQPSDRLAADMSPLRELSRICLVPVVRHVR